MCLIAGGHRARGLGRHPHSQAGVPRQAGCHRSWHENREGQGVRAEVLRAFRWQVGQLGAPAGSPGSPGPLTSVLHPSIWLSRAPSLPSCLPHSHTDAGGAPGHLPGDRHCLVPGGPAFTQTHHHGSLGRVQLCQEAFRNLHGEVLPCHHGRPQVGSRDPSACTASPSEHAPRPFPLLDVPFLVSREL